MTAPSEKPAPKLAKRLVCRSWLIWNHERGMWWRANRSGYSEAVQEAGRYKFAEALEICQQANRFVGTDAPRPEESMVPDFVHNPNRMLD